MSLRRPPIPVVFRLSAGLLLLSQGGCMSALTTAAMREALRETVDSLAAAAATDDAASAGDADVSASLATDEVAIDSAPVISEPKPPSLDDAVDRAVARLKAVGELDAPTQATLLSILEKTSPEDWPIAIDAFAASLEAYRPAPRRPAPAPMNPPPAATAGSEPDDSLMFPTSASPSGHTPPLPIATTVVFEPPAETLPVEPEVAAAEPQAEATLMFPATTPGHEPARLAVIEAARPVGPGPDDATPVFAPRTTLEPSGAQEPITLAAPLAAGEPPAAAVPSPAAEPAPSAEAPAAVEPPAAVAPAPATLVVRNACFVSRVRAWGVVDTFPEAVFRPGQDVIVYFELESPTARRSPAGHTTSIDTIFRLFAPDGRQVGQWDFEPIDETCRAPRRDYFARYFVRIPEAAHPGPYRLDLMVTDLVAGVSSQAGLDLEVRP